MWARRATWRRSAKVASSGSHTAGKNPAASSCANTAASTLSVLTLASAIARVFWGLETTTRPTWRSSSRAIAYVLPVASRTTSSVAHRLAANSRSPSGVVWIRPACRTTPASQMATWANSRCTSRPIHRRIRPPFGRCRHVGSTGGPNDTYGSALTAHPGWSQGRPRTNSGSQPIERSPACPTCVCSRMPLSRTVAPYSRLAGDHRQPIRGRRRHPPPFIPVTNPIESTFSPVRARTRVTKGPGAKDMGLAMVFKLLQAAEGRWRKVNGPDLVALVRARARFE
jgi:hypothetical protein